MIELESKKTTKLLRPKIDVVFHALFREENKRLTENLISEIIGEKVKIKTTDLNRYLDIKVAEQKLGIMDLRTELQDGTKCNIEIQLDEHKYEMERFLYYWADAYTRQLLRGENYEELNKTISIIILDHEIEELKGLEELGIKWQIRDNVTGKRVLTQNLEMIIVEIPKAIREYKRLKTNKIGQWMIFLDNPNKKEMGEIMKNNKEIKEAVDELKQVSKDEEIRILAELREKGRRDHHAAMSFAEEKGFNIGLKKGTRKGIEEGRKKGREEGRKDTKEEIAKKMLQMNIEKETISYVTGLSIEEINKIDKI